VLSDLFKGVNVECIRNSRYCYCSEQCWGV